MRDEFLVEKCRGFSERVRKAPGHKKKRRMGLKRVQSDENIEVDVKRLKKQVSEYCIDERE